MASSTFEKVMRNRTISERSRSMRYNDSRDSWTFPITVNAEERAVLRTFFAIEQNFYNNLVQGFNSRLRCFPESLIAMGTPWEELFADLAMLSLHPRDIALPLPATLERHHAILFDGNGKRAISERMLLILELAAGGKKFAPQTRRAMAVEIVRFYRQQAQVSTASVPAGMREANVYKTPPEILQPIEPGHKRHVQVPRSAVVLKVADDKQSTALHIPYLRNGIVVPGDCSKSAWNLLVVRQNYEYSASPWKVEMRKSPVQYLLKLFDTRRRVHDPQDSPKKTSSILPSHRHELARYK